MMSWIIEGGGITTDLEIMRGNHRQTMRWTTGDRTSHPGTCMAAGNGLLKEWIVVIGSRVVIDITTPLAKALGIPL